MHLPVRSNDTMLTGDPAAKSMAKRLVCAAAFLLAVHLVSAQMTLDSTSSSLKNHDQHPTCMPLPSTAPDSHYFKKNASVVIGGLFPLFKRPDEIQGSSNKFPFADVSDEGIQKTCSEFRSYRLVDNSQIFAYVINNVYNGTLQSTVPGRSIDIGYTLADSCSSLFVNSRMALRFASEIPLVGRKSFCGLRDELLPQCPQPSVNISASDMNSNGSGTDPTTEPSTNVYRDVSSENPGATTEDVGVMCPSGTSVPIRNMAIAVGLTESRVVLPVSTIFTIEKLTHISPSATGNGFVNHSGGQLPYFFRTAAPDQSQAQALIDIVVHFKWNYIIALASSNDNYGTPGLIKLQQAALLANVCIAYSTTFSSVDPLRDVVIPDIVNNLMLYDDAKVVILFARSYEAELLFKAIVETRENLSRSGSMLRAKKLDKLWLGSDYWGTSSRLQQMKNLAPAVPVALVLRPRLPLNFTDFITERVNGYVDYLLSLTTRDVRQQSETDNPWLCHFWEDVFGCGNACSQSYAGRKKSWANVSCDNPKFRLTLSKIEEIAPRLGWTRNILAATELSVRALKILLDSIPADTPADQVTDRLLTLANGKAMREAVRNVTFPCTQGECQLLTRVSEPSPAFSISNFITQNSSDVGHWELVTGAEGKRKAVLQLQEDLILWSERIPANISSTCRKKCGFGQGTKDNPDRPCCTECIDCSKKERAPENGIGSCEGCGNGETASENRTACIPLPRKFLDWGDPIGIVLTVAVVVCMSLVIFTLAVFCYYRASPVAKASDYHLMILILIGMLVGYAVALVQIGRPSKLHCLVAKLAQSPPFIFTTATLLIKTSRLARMAIAAQQMVTFTRKWTLSIPAQVIFICIVSFIGITLELTLTLTHTPTVKELYHDDTPHVYLLCDYDSKRSAVLDVYIVILILVTSVFAFITRKMPMNFNEARHIFLTSFCLCAVWGMLAPPIYFSDTKYVAVLYSLRLLTHMAAIWLFLFTPRLYIFLFRKHRNSVYADHVGRGSRRRRSGGALSVASDRAAT
ncbi:extracellular calcium-sensing receptor-like [Sycon ciliatum]|uniref:extracellular calcium-sensing receptor-like n=1 Tax=Sycon ciliatum TaxID=27933 RepID=UPI0020A891F7|eukprot:scpid23085/ scgid34978/ Extracellular calcium-sensing receptor; Parathyroid cell calcium-sensing receptor